MTIGEKREGGLEREIAEYLRIHIKGDECECQNCRRRREGWAKHIISIIRQSSEVPTRSNTAKDKTD